MLKKIFLFFTGLKKTNFYIQTKLRSNYVHFFILILTICSFAIINNCDKKHKSLISPDEAVYPGTPISLSVKIDDKQVVLSWEIADTAGIHCYFIYKRDSVETEMVLVDSVFTQQYIDTNVKNGKLYVYTVAAINNEGYEGKRSQEVQARANIFDIIIKNGDEYTNNKSVILKFTAPLATKNMLISNDSLLTDASWESFVSFKNWILSDGDGEKKVYVKFKDNDGNENNTPATDKIILDTKAIIIEATENTNGIMKKPGEIIHFSLKANETEGTATVDIGNVKTGIELYDDGTNGDNTADDSIYELDFTIPSGLEIVNGVVTTHFTDRVGNVAISVNTTGTITIQQAPVEVKLSPPVVSGSNQKILELYWSQNQDSDFASYRLFRSETSNVDTASTLIVTINNRSETNYKDSNVEEQTDYYYRVFVCDGYGLITGSNEVHGKINLEAPNSVVLNPPTPIGSSLTSLGISWSKNNDNDFARYQLYRARTSGVDNTSKLIATITDQHSTNFEDSDLLENTQYFYRLFVYNIDGLSSGSNEVSGQTNVNEPPVAVNLLPPTPTGNSLTSLNLSWSQNSETDFSCYKLYRSKIAGVDSTSDLVTMITDNNNTNYEDTNLLENTEYYYKLYVLDIGGLATGSNEVSGRTNANEPPYAVELHPPSPVVNSLTSLSLSWAKSEDNDFASYKIFRSKNTGVDSTSDLVTMITDNNNTNYEDTNLSENTEYYYRIYVFDTGGLATGSNEESGRTNMNEPPEAVDLYPPSPVVNSLSSLSLSWSKNDDDDFASYKLYRSENTGVDSTSLLVITITDNNNTNYEDTELDQNTEYFYKVYVYDTRGLSTGSDEESGKTNTNESPTAVILSTPSPVVNSFSSLSLSWSKNDDTDFSSYKIYRSKTAGVTLNSILVTTITNKNTTNFTDTDLDENTDYFYKVYIYDTGGLSSGSNEEQGTTNANEPPKAVVLANPSVVDSVTLRLAWSQNDDDDFSMYLIYRSESSPVDTTQAPIAIINNQNSTEYSDTNLVKNTKYYYQIFVVDKGGLVTGSNTVEETPKP